MNPYTYIFNNPLSGIDPTGYIAELTNPFGCNTTFGGGCAQDGNIFAQADSVRNHAASFNGRAQSGPSKNDKGISDLGSGNFCSGVLTCYAVTRNIEGKFVVGKQTDSLGQYNFLNGILNKKNRAGAEVGPIHLDESLIDESIDSFVLIHNPTKNMFKDGLETLQDKFGHSKAAIQLSALINQKNAEGQPFYIVAHSQGTQILKSAIKHNKKTRGTNLSNLRVRLHGPAVNVALAKRTFRKNGIKLFGKNGGVDINSGDAVANIIGLNTWNPWHILKSIFLSPTLSSKVGKGSPHTFPVGCNEQGCN